MPRRMGRLVKQSGILMGMELGIRLIDALVAVILARYLAPQGFGLMAFALSFASLFSMIPGFGMGSLSIRDLARNPEQVSHYLANGLVAKAFLAAFTFALIFILTQFMGFAASKTLIVMLAALLMVVETNVVFPLGFFQAAQRMWTVALVQLAIRVGWLIAALAVIGMRGGLVELLGSRAAVTAVGLITALVLIDRRLQRIRWSVNLRFIPWMLKSSFPFVLFRVFSAYHLELGVVMLSMIRGDVVTGWLVAAQKIIRVFQFVPRSLYEVMVPELSRPSRTLRTDILATLTRSWKYLLLIALPIAGGTYILADRFILLLYGQAYAPAAPALRILIWLIPFGFVNSTLRAAVVSVDLERQTAVALMGVLALNALLNLVAIPHFGLVGAAGTLLLTTILTFLLQLLLLRRALPTLGFSNGTIKPVLATVGMMAFTWLSRDSGLVYAILGSVAVYVGCLVLLRVIGRDEWSLLNGIVRPKAIDERA
ncbi:MAG: flippase [Candidatus Omnitrophica bacterium]|nr:flippase [Candidatus Omnitrophota bacterium]